MFVLDSDHLSLIDRADSASGGLIRERMEQIGLSEFATTIANFDEQTRAGWLTLLGPGATPI